MPLQLNITIDRASAQSLKHALEKLPLELQDKAARKALNKYGKVAVAAAKPSIEWRTVERGMRAKVKKYKGVMWVAIAAALNPAQVKKLDTLGGRARRRSYDQFSPGWRQHWEDLGFHTWQKGWQRVRRAAGRGWKKGLKHRGRGVFHQGSNALSKAAQATAASFRQICATEIAAFIKEKNR